MTKPHQNQVDFKSTFKVGDVVEGHSTDKLYYITAIGHGRFLGIDRRGYESVGTMSGWNKWRVPDDLRRRDDFLAYIKTEVLK